MNILLRKDAIKLGLKRYFNGVPCPRGHIAERLVKGQCVVCDREDTLARNRGKAKELAVYASEYRRSNPEKVAATSKAYRERNPEKVKAWKSADQKRNKASADTRKQRYVEANRPKLRERVNAWQKANRGICTANTRRRQAGQLQRTPAWADSDRILYVYKLCAAFRELGADYEVDHVVPLRGKRVSGLHVHENLQIINATRNRQKSNHF